MKEAADNGVQSQAQIKSSSPSKLKSRVMMIGIFMVFFGPIFLAMFLYFNLDIWHPAKTMNHGELILPTAPLKLLDLTDNDSGKPVTLDTLKERWTLIYVGEGGCDANCEANLVKVRQLRILLGRDLQRVQYLFLALDASAKDAADRLAQVHPRMMRTHIASGTEDKQLTAFGDNPVGAFYLVDPLGNLVLRYPKDYKARGMLRDLRRLLKVSKIG